MFYCQIPAEQRPAQHLKTAVDAVEILDRFRQDAYNGHHHILHAQQIGGRSQTLEAIRAGIWGRSHEGISAPAILETVLRHDIHGTDIPISESTSSDAGIESVQHLVLKDGALLQETGYQPFTLVVHLVTDLGRDPHDSRGDHALRSVVSSASSRLQNMLEQTDELSDAEIIFVVSDEAVEAD